jgi:hypothetical protein
MEVFDLFLEILESKNILNVVKEALIVANTNCIEKEI